MKAEEMEVVKRIVNIVEMNILSDIRLIDEIQKSRILNKESVKTDSEKELDEVRLKECFEGIRSRITESRILLSRINYESGIEGNDYHERQRDVEEKYWKILN